METKLKNCSAEETLVLGKRNYAILISHAQEHHKDSKPQTALAELENALKIKPEGSFDLYLLRGKILFEQQKHESALKEVNLALGFQPLNFKALIFKGEILYELGFKEQCIDMYDECLKNNPPSSFNQYLIYKANIMVELRKFEEAVLVYNQIINAKFERKMIFAAYINKGKVLKITGKYEEALQSYQKAGHLKPKDKNVFKAIAKLLARLNRKKEANNVYDKIMSKIDCADVLAFYGKMKLNLNKEDESSDNDINRSVLEGNISSNNNINNIGVSKERKKIRISLNANDKQNKTDIKDECYEDKMINFKGFNKDNYVSNDSFREEDLFMPAKTNSNANSREISLLKKKLAKMNKDLENKELEIGEKLKTIESLKNEKKSVNEKIIKFIRSKTNPRSELKTIKDIIPTYSSERMQFKDVKFAILEESLTESRHLFEYYSCKICLNLVINPKECGQCENLFCTECLKNAIDKSSNDRCGLCLQSPFSEGIMRKSGRNILNLFRFKCPLGCDMVISYREIEDHFSNTCEKIPKTITCDLCLKRINNPEESVYQKELELHNDECPFLIVECCFCGNSCRKSHFPNHFLDCSENYAVCTKCHVYYNPKNRESHNDKFCEILDGIISIADK